MLGVVARAGDDRGRVHLDRDLPRNEFGAGGPVHSDREDDNQAASSSLKPQAARSPSSRRRSPSLLGRAFAFLPRSRPLEVHRPPM